MRIVTLCNVKHHQLTTTTISETVRTATIRCYFATFLPLSFFGGRHRSHIHRIANDSVGPVPEPPSGGSSFHPALVLCFHVSSRILETRSFVSISVYFHLFENGSHNLITKTIINSQDRQRSVLRSIITCSSYNEEFHHDCGHDKTRHADSSWEWNHCRTCSLAATLPHTPTTPQCRLQRIAVTKAQPF
jgi:hypothetical protein